MTRRPSIALAALLGALLAPATLACQTDSGLFDRHEGTFEEMGEEIDRAADEIDDEVDG